MDHIRRTQDVKGMHQLLLTRDKSTLNVRLKHYQNKDEETEPMYPMNKPKNKEDVVHTFVRLDRKDILRMEVMFSDMSKVFPDHYFTVERILEILLIDFVTKYEKGEAVNILLKDIK